MLTAATALSVLVMMFVLDATLYSLMLVAEQIVHGLHWVEGTERNLNEYCIPVTHRTIPETWQLECLQILTIFALAGIPGAGRGHEPFRPHPGHVRG